MVSPFTHGPEPKPQSHLLFLSFSPSHIMCQQVLSSLPSKCILKLTNSHSLYYTTLPLLHHHLLIWHLRLLLLPIVSALCNSHSGTFKTEYFLSANCSEPCNSHPSNTDGPNPHYMVPPDSFPATLSSDSPAPLILANFLSLKHSKEDAIARLMPFQNSTWNSPPLGIHRTLTSYKCLPKCHLFGENLPDHPVSHHTPSSFPHLIFLIARLSNWPSIICLPTVCLPHRSLNFWWAGSGLFTSVLRT